MGMVKGSNPSLRGTRPDLQAKQQKASGEIKSHRAPNVFWRQENSC